MLESTILWVIKVIPAVVGAILALMLSGDIDKTGKIQVSMGVIGKFLASVTVSLYGGRHLLSILKCSNVHDVSGLHHAHVRDVRPFIHRHSVSVDCAAEKQAAA